MEEITLYTSIEKKLILKATENRIPINAIFELTPHCNFNCNMCYVHSSKNELQQVTLLTYDDWIRIAKQLRDAGTLFVLLTGGEPLLYPDFKRLYLALQDMGMVLTINSNGSLFDDSWIDFFSKHRPRRINITLYGSSADTYNTLCHNASAYDNVMKTITSLQSAGVDVKVNGSITTENVDDVPEIIEFCKKNDVFSKLDTYLYPSSICDSTAFCNSRLAPEIAAKVRMEITEATTDAIYFEKQLETTYARAMHPISDHDVHAACRAGRSSVAIHYDGNLTPCTMLSTPSINLSDVDVAKAWAQLTVAVDHILLHDDCGECNLRDLCQTCMACAMCETGSFDKKPEYMCAYTKATFERVKDLRNV